MKKFLIILASLSIMGYLAFVVVYFWDSSRNQECNCFEVVVKNSAKTQFVHAEDIVQLIKSKDLYPVGKRMDEVNTLDIQHAIMTNKLVKSAEVYSTSNGSIIANIYQRNPILRVISDTEGHFYVDKNREIMPTSSRFTVHVPIATGNISEEFAKDKLYDFAKFLYENSEWDAWIEQIVVKKNERVELIPRVGDFRIILGTLDNYPAKLAKFALFAKNGLNVVGWNRYSEINLSFDNQVVCTKK